MSNTDHYGFIREEGSNDKQNEKFMASYGKVLKERKEKWDSLMKYELKEGSKLKRFVRKGIPEVYRKDVWMQLSGASKKRKSNPDHFTTMLKKELSEKIDEQIRNDLPRTFPDNIYFNKSSDPCYQNQLYNILRAYANSNPKVAYCQGLNYIAGLLYVVTKDEDSSFWLLKELCERIIPEYHTTSMPGLLTDVKVLEQLVLQQIPDLGVHINQLQIPWELFCSKWFICAYCEVLPVETVLRVWDAVFHEGSKILFRVALGLLQLNKDSLMSKTDFASMAEEIKKLGSTSETIDCHAFMEYIFDKTGAMPRKKIDKLREEFGKLVREEQLEREKKRKQDGSGLKDG